MADDSSDYRTAWDVTYSHETRIKGFTPGPPAKRSTFDLLCDLAIAGAIVFFSIWILRGCIG